MVQKICTGLILILFAFMVMLFIGTLIGIWSPSVYEMSFLERIVSSIGALIALFVGGFFTLCILAAMDVPLDTPIFVSNQQTFDNINITYDPKKNNEIQRIEGVTTLYEKEDAHPLKALKPFPRTHTKPLRTAR